MAGPVIEQISEAPVSFFRNHTHIGATVRTRTMKSFGATQNLSHSMLLSIKLLREQPGYFWI